MHRVRKRAAAATTAEDASTSTTKRKGVLFPFCHVPFVQADILLLQRLPRRPRVRLPAHYSQVKSITPSLPRLLPPSSVFAFPSPPSRRR